MPENSTPANRATTEVAGLYLNKYQEIVKPNQRFLVSNYFIHYWLRKLGPALAWVIVSLQQACWRADNDTCTISQMAIADEVGLTDRTIRKILKQNSFRHWFIPEIQYQPGNFNHKKQVYQPLPNKYVVYLSSPLIPEHLAGLYGYLQTSCPAGQPDQVNQAVTNLLDRQNKACLILLEEHAQDADYVFDRPVPLAEVVTLATGLNVEALPPAIAKPLQHNLDKLQTHLTEIGSTVCRQYFRLTWVPRLGPAAAWLVMSMRSRCYYNPETGELRDTHTWRKKELAELLGQSTKNLSNLLSHPDAHLFCQMLEQNKRQITVQVSMVHEPLLPEDPAEMSHPPQISPENRKNIPVTPPENRKNIPVTIIESEKSSGHPPENRKKVPPYKYFKESILIVDNGHKDSRQNKGVVDNAKDEIKKLLLSAGLSSTGLSKLCDKSPPLDLRQVRAVLLYAEAHDLGPGYIYRHLEHDDSAIDDLFLQFAALDDETLGLFRAAVSDLRISGTFAPEIRVPLPETHLDLFIRFAEVFTGIEAARVAAILSQRPPPTEAAYSGEPAPHGTGSTNGSTYPISMTAEDELETFWQQALEQLQIQMTQGTFDTWLKGTRLIARDGLRFTIAVKNDFARDWLEHRLFTTIERTLINLLKAIDDPDVPPVEIDFVVEDLTPLLGAHHPRA